MRINVAAEALQAASYTLQATRESPQKLKVAKEHKEERCHVNKQHSMRECCLFINNSYSLLLSSLNIEY
jgi:hypothetical protein